MKKSKTLESHIGYWLRFVSNHVSLSFADRLAECGVGVGEWVALNLLNENKSMSPGEIAKLVGMTRGAASKLLDRLYCKGLITREESVTDRRYHEITLSVQGKELLPRLIKEAEMNEQQFFGSLSKEQKQLLTTLLKDIISIKKWTKVQID
ncbi:MAG: MarR family transcriptional regulator [Candidatus Protochlamydia sp.]|nr:MarR family transcriptional regulator [Candidatus Protochlamydia sp.]